MRTAIGLLNQDPTAHRDHPELILQGTYLRSILLASFSPSTIHPPTALQAPGEVGYPPHDALDHNSRIPSDHGGVFRDDMRIQSWARRYVQFNPVIAEGDPELHLNATQIRAIAMMIGEQISLVQGVSYRYL